MPDIGTLIPVRYAPANMKFKGHFYIAFLGPRINTTIEEDIIQARAREHSRYNMIYKLANGLYSGERRS